MRVNVERLLPSNPWQDAYGHVAGAARLYLASLDDWETISTNDLVEALLPEDEARGDGIVARKRIYRALSALTEHELNDCCRRGNERRLPKIGKIVVPWLWHAPRALVAAE